MGFYVELHCDTEECPHGGNEEGVQGTNRASIKRDALAAGWVKVGGRWLCDKCAADEGLDSESRQQRSRFAKKIHKRAGRAVDAFSTIAGLASADTHPTGGDAQQAPFMSGAVDAEGSETPNKEAHND